MTNKQYMERIVKSRARMYAAQALYREAVYAAFPKGSRVIHTRGSPKGISCTVLDHNDFGHPCLFVRNDRTNNNYWVDAVHMKLP